MSSNNHYGPLSDKEDTVPIGSLNVLSAKYEVSYCYFLLKKQS